MPYVQHTKCTPPADFDPLNVPLVVIGGISGLLAMITALFIAAAVPVAGVVLILSGGGLMLASIVATFEYLLGGKLICLGGDIVAAGSVLSTEPPSEKSFPENLDNDLSINLLLCPHIKNVDDPGRVWKPSDLPDIDLSESKYFMDHLVTAQPGSNQHNLPLTGYETNDSYNKPIFHIELEGSRIANTYKAFLAAWALLVIAAGVAAGLSAIPVIGWLLALLAMLFGAILGGSIVAVTWAASADGSVTDINESFGEVHNGDHLVAYGTWTYDSGHNNTGVGWNEIHPVKHLSKVDRCINEKEAKKWEALLAEKFTDIVIEKQGSLVDSTWELHPMVDGCEPNYDANIK